MKVPADYKDEGNTLLEELRYYDTKNYKLMRIPHLIIENVTLNKYLLFNEYKIT